MRQVGRLASKTLNRVTYAQSLVLLRQAAGTRVGYDFIPGETIQLTFKGVVIPDNQGKSRVNALEGEVLKEKLKIYVKINEYKFIAPVRYGTEATQADKIRFNTLTYNVTEVDELSYNGIICVRMEREDDQNG